MSETRRRARRLSSCPSRPQLSINSAPEDRDENPHPQY